MSKLFIGAMLTVAWHQTVEAAPVPAWCKDHGFSGRANVQVLASSNASAVVGELAHAACVPSPETEANRASLEQSRQAWGKRLGMQEADWADVVAYEKQPSPPPVFSTKDVTKYTAVDQYIAITEGFDRPGGQGPLREPIYATDVFEGKLTEVGRFGYLSRCFGTAGATLRGPVEWAICAGDIEAFDLAKFHRQLSLDTVHDGAFKMGIRFEAMTIAADLKKHATVVQAAWAKDPAYKKMFDIAAAARSEWRATLAKETQLLDLVAAAESAHFSGSRSALEACAAKTPAALVEQVGKLPAKSFAKMFDVRFEPDHGAGFQIAPVLVNTPAVNLAAMAYALCNRDAWSKFLAIALQATPGTRGPRTLVFTRMLTEKIQLDDVNERITFPPYERPYDVANGGIITSGGVVASAVPNGELVTVKFEKLVVKREECIASHQTGKIYKLHPDGRVEYEQVCDKMGIVAHDEQWMDFQVKRKALPLLKKGTRISVVHGDSRDEGAEVFATWANSKADAPNWLLGATLR